MRISSMSLKNIKCFEKLNIDFYNEKIKDIPQVCAFVGANGVGKTTILQSIVSTFSLIDPIYRGSVFNNTVITVNNNEATIDISLKFNKSEIKSLEKLGIGDNFKTIVASQYSLKKEKNYNDDWSYADVIFPEGISPNRYIVRKINRSDEFSVNELVKMFEIAKHFDMAENIFKELEKKIYKNPELKKVCILQQKYQNLLGYISRPNKCLIIYIDAFRYMTSASSKTPIFENMGCNAKNCAMKNSVIYDEAMECDKMSLRNFNLKQWLINLDYAHLKGGGNVHTEAVYKFLIKTCNLFFDEFEYLKIDGLGNVLFREKENVDNILSLNMLSDGFKSVFMIVGEIIERLSIAYKTDIENDIEFNEGEAVVLIDEIDCHMHPKWQRNFIPKLKKLFPNCQFIITTHSPYILDSLQEYEIKQIGERDFV